MTAIRAVVFDIGGVLEITPGLGTIRQWEARLGLAAGEADERLCDVWARGSVGALSEPEVHRAIRDRLGLDGRQLTAFLADLWREYLGTPNTPLIEYARLAPPAVPHRHPEQQLRRCPGAGAGGLRLRGPGRRDRLLARSRAGQTGPPQLRPRVRAAGGHRQGDSLPR